MPTRTLRQLVPAALVVALAVTAMSLVGCDAGDSKVDNENPTAPGTVIDLGGGNGNAITFTKDYGTPMAKTNDGLLLDEKFFNKPMLTQVMNRDKMLAWPVKRDKSAIVHYSDGRKLRITPRATVLEWTCIDAEGVENKLSAGNAGDLPGCMVGTMGANEIEYTDNVPVQGNWFHAEVQ